MSSSRRDFLKSTGLSIVGLSFIPTYLNKAMGETIKNIPPQLKKKTLVFIFMRGAADGLAIVPPLKDPFYNKELRPTIFMGSDVALPLDGFFGLHPALKEIHPLWEQGMLSIVHQVGSPDATRSHFDAQDFMESGTPGVKATEDGFIDRVVPKLKASDTPLKIVALQPNLPRSLWGTHGAFAMNSIKEFQDAKGLATSTYEKNFESMYDNAMDTVLKGAGEKTFQSMNILKSLPAPSEIANYPKSQLGKRLSDIARLVKGGVGLEIAVTECGGWDTHQHQGNAEGQLAGKLKDLAESMAAFNKDLGNKIEDVCVITMTEFGRTVHENGNGGTDHGHGSVMLVMGGGVKENMYEERDLAITTDYRDVWKEILTSHLSVKDMDKIFPGFSFSNKKLGLMKG
jgi:uncharacterized protein (DUF1501 family)